MNFRNEKYFIRSLTNHIKVCSYGNFHIVSTRDSYSITVNAYYPTTYNLASIYMMYTKLKDYLSSCNLPHKFCIERNTPTLYLSPNNYLVTIRRYEEYYQLTIKCIHIHSYGTIQYNTLFDQRCSLNNICLICNKYLQ